MARKETLVAGAMLIIIAYTVGLSFVGQVLSESQTITTVPTTGVVEAIGVDVYWDYQCTNPLTTIDWGTLEPGSDVNVVCYIENSGTSPVTLSMTTANWTPSAASYYIILSWDYGGQTIGVGDSRRVEFTLSVSQNIQGISSFGFDITIVGSG